MGEVQVMEDWLAERGLQRYADIFWENEIFRLHDLAIITMDDLVEMGIKAVGPRRKLLNHIADLRAETKRSMLPPLLDKRRGTGHRHSSYLGHTEKLSSRVGRLSSRVEKLSSRAEKLSSFGGQYEEESEGITEEESYNNDPFEAELEDCDLMPWSAALEDAIPTLKALEGENSDLQEITDMAQILLACRQREFAESTSHPEKANHNDPNRVDVEFFRTRMQQRIERFRRDSTPPPSAGLAGLANWRPPPPVHLPKVRVDYRSLIQRQMEEHEEMEKVHGRYQELLTQCLSQIAEDLEEQVQLGDYGDATMVRFRQRLAQLVGLTPRPDTAQVQAEEASFHSALGITEATLARRTQLQHELEKTLQMLGKAADDILDPEEVRSACARDERVRRQVEVLAFNLAFDPEVRQRKRNKAAAGRIQAQLEEVLRMINVSGDGFVSRQEIDRVPADVRRLLLWYGMPDIFDK
eukprot:EG_transcript_4299